MKRSAFFAVVFSLVLVSVSTVRATDDVERAIHLFRSHQYEEAKVLFEKILGTDDNNAEIHYYLGRTYLILGDHDKAVDHCERAVELRGDVADYHFWLAQSYGVKAMNANMFAKASLASKIREAYEKTVELDSTHIQGRVGLINFYLQAPSFMGGGVDKARAQVEMLIQLDEKRGRAVLAQIYVREDKLDLAEAEYKWLEEEYGDSQDSYSFYNNEYGYFLLNQKRYDEAIEKFEKQVALAPDHANAYDSLGDGYRAAGRLEDAADAYRKALEIDPHFAASKKNLEKVEKEMVSQTK